MSVHVTLHAIRRYAECSLKLWINPALTDPQAVDSIATIEVIRIRKRLLTLARVAEALGACSILADGVRIKMLAGTVVTVLPKGSPILRDPASQDDAPASYFNSRTRQAPDLAWKKSVHEMHGEAA